MQWFGYDLPQGYLVANFMADAHAGNTGTEVTFSDITLKGTGVTLTNWAWDFQNDGIIDSYMAYPKFTYTLPGTYDVRFIAASATKSDTIICEDFYTANNGVFVYEGMEGARDMSGSWMRDFMLSNGYIVTYATEIPRYIDGYDALFLSFGNTASFNSVFEDGLARMLKGYLQKGGRVYLEGGAAMGTDQNSHPVWDLFGLQNALNPGPVPSFFDTVAGMPGSICEGISFFGTNQLGQLFIDRYNPNDEGIVAFEQPGYGNVAVQHPGPNGEKTFCFSYALAELQDSTSTREDLMWAILNYFDLITSVPGQIPGAAGLDLKVFPVPASRQITISFDLVSSGNTLLMVYDLSGKMLCIRDFGRLGNGFHSEIFDLDLPGGIYIMKVLSGDRAGIRKIVKL